MPQHPIPSASSQEQQSLPSNQSNNNSSQQQQAEVATIEAPPRTIQIPVVTCDFASDMSTSEVADRDSGENQVAANPKDLLRVGTANVTTANIRNVVSTTTTLSSSNGTGTATTTTTTSVNALQVSPMAGRCRALSVGIETDMVSEFDPSSSDSGVVSRCAAVKPHKFRVFQPIFGRRAASSRKDGGSSGGGGGGKSHGNQSSKAIAVANNNKAAAELQPALPKKEKARDPEKEKRRIARKKEKRATLILGLIMGSFIACWLPFFFLYILVPMCPTCEIPEAAFALAFWLGYMNSALNPAIYTIFNKDFRRAFRRILFK